MKTIWVDVETTGLDPAEDRIIELAAIFEDGDGEPDEFHVYCKPFPERPAGFDKIQEITGIAWERLIAIGLSDALLKRTFCDFLSKHIDKFDHSDKAVFAGYNGGFDRRFVTGLFERNGDKYSGSWFRAGTLDVMSSVHTDLRISGRPALPSMKLSVVADMFGIKFQPHSAIEDVRATRQIQRIIESRFTGKDRPEQEGAAELLF